MGSRIKKGTILILLFVFIISNNFGVNIFLDKNIYGESVLFVNISEKKADAATAFHYWNKYTAIDVLMDNSPWILSSENSHIGDVGQTSTGKIVSTRLYTDYTYDQVSNSYDNAGSYLNIRYTDPYTVYYQASTYSVYKYVIKKCIDGDTISSYYGDIYIKQAARNTQVKQIGNFVQTGIIAPYDAYQNNNINSDGFWYIRSGLVGYAPDIAVDSPLQQNIYGKENINIEPVISVKDEDNSILTCKYYLDDETITRDTETVTDTTSLKKVVFSPVNISTLADGEHTIRFEVNDNLDTVTETVKFNIDNSGPKIDNIVINSTEKTISVGSLILTDNTEVNIAQYRFSMESYASNWIRNPQYMFLGLLPNTIYTVKYEVKDALGNITVNEKNIYTKAQIPTLTVENITSTTADFKVLSENPENTQYQIMCDSKYIDSNGTLTNTPTWITVPHKVIKITGLSPEASYKFAVKAKNMENIETELSGPVEVKTHADVPTNLSANPYTTTIALTWSPITEVYEYEIEADGIIKTVKTTSFIHTGLAPNTQHSYRVRAKKANEICSWSLIITSMTEYKAPENILNIKSYPTNVTTSLVWDETKDAEYYEIEFDGTLISNIKNPFHTVAGLTPVTQYTYRVRAVNTAGEGNWSNYETVTTHLLGTPSNINSLESENEVTLTWDAVDKTNEYEIEINGQAPVVISTNSYKHTGLTEETQYFYRIKAKNAEGESAWSNAITVTTLPVRPGIPNKFRAFTDENIVTLSWDSADRAIGYDVELDGVLIDNGDSRTYIHEDLSPTTVHKYRVRAKTDAVEGEWTDYLELKTMAGKPEAPKDIKVDTTPTITTLSWKAEEEALGYDIEIDGEVISDITSTSYRHRRITPLTEHVYRIRTRNITGISPWSGYMINNSIKAICKKGKDVDLGLTASDIVDFSKYTLTVTYNKDVLDVNDLCTFSPKIELKKGIIEGTGITVTEHTPGKIVFVVDKSIPPGESWTGVINSIKFKAKVSGGTNITYTVFSKSEE